LRDPAAVDFVGDHQLAGLVIQLDDEIFAEVAQRYLAPQASTVVPDFVGPLLELPIVGHAPLQGDRLILGAARRLAAAARVAAVTMLDHLSSTLQGADLADAGDVATVPLDAELEILVRVEALRIDAELSHRLPP